MMVSQGIYTLANDVVYDQLVALLNSIEVNVGTQIPIYVIPFDERLDKVKTEIANRDQVTLYDDQDSIKRWETFAQEVWSAFPDEKKQKLGKPPWGKGHHRKFIAFDGPCETFVYYDADSLAMKPLNQLFEQLKQYDFVFDDWEHSKSNEDAALDIPLILSTGIYSEEIVRQQLHCSSFFGSHQGIFDKKELEQLQQKLIEEKEIAWVSRWWDDAFLFNYLTLRGEQSVFNFTKSSNGEDRTGNCADADPFVNIDNVLYNEQGLKPIHRIHYMNYSSTDFTRLCQGEDANINYKDTFLHYRFLKNPDKKPTQLVPPSSLKKATRKLQGIMGKIKRNIS
ncbi:MAG: Npun_R2821/Npun_R2822 family protein [Crocosphaera sp.]